MRRVLVLTVLLTLLPSCTNGVDGSTTVPPTTTKPTTAEVPTTTAPVFTAGAAGIGDDYYPTLGNGGYDVVHYDLDVTYRTDGSVSIEAVIAAVAEQNLDRFTFDFHGWEIDDVSIDDVAAVYRRENGELIINEVQIASGTGFEVVVAYHGVPEPTESAAVPFRLGWFSGPNGEQFVLAQPDGAHAWFPSNDHPLDKATFAFRLSVPGGFVAAANGELTAEEHTGTTTTYSWEMDNPMATYLATVVIGESWEIVEDTDSTEVAGVPIRNVLRPGIDDGPREALAKTGEMLVFLEDAFGPYPFDEYGIAVVGPSEMTVALENQTLSVFGRGMVEHPYFEYVLVHELAHQWFGNSVSVARWGDIWLNEGFATFAELLWVEHIFGPVAYREEIANRMEVARVNEYGPPGTPPPNDLLNRSVYQRGSFVLVALRDEIGDDAFFEILRTHATRFADGNVTTEEFIALSEEISGYDLDELFDDWLYGQELPAW